MKDEKDEIVKLIGNSLEEVKKAIKYLMALSERKGTISNEILDNLQILPENMTKVEKTIGDVVDRDTLRNFIYEGHVLNDEKHKDFTKILEKVLKVPIETSCINYEKLRFAFDDYLLFHIDDAKDAANELVALVKEFTMPVEVSSEKAQIDYNSKDFRKGLYDIFDMHEADSIRVSKIIEYIQIFSKEYKKPSCGYQGTKILREGLSNIIKGYSEITNPSLFRDEVVAHIIQYVREDFECEADVAAFPGMLKDFLERHKKDMLDEFYGFLLNNNDSRRLTDTNIRFLLEKAEEESKNGK